MAAVKLSEAHSEALDLIISELSKKGIKITKKEMVERLIEELLRDKALLDRLVWKPLSEEEAEELLSSLEADLGVENTKEDMVRTLYSSLG